MNKKDRKNRLRKLYALVHVNREYISEQMHEDMFDGKAPCSYCSLLYCCKTNQCSVYHKWFRKYYKGR